MYNQQATWDDVDEIYHRNVFTSVFLLLSIFADDTTFDHFWEESKTSRYCVDITWKITSTAASLSTPTWSLNKSMITHFSGFYRTKINVWWTWVQTRVNKKVLTSIAWVIRNYQFGKFALTRRFMTFNQTVKHKWNLKVNINTLPCYISTVSTSFHAQVYELATVFQARHLLAVEYPCRGLYIL